MFGIPIGETGWGTQTLYQILQNKFKKTHPSTKASEYVWDSSAIFESSSSDSPTLISPIDVAIGNIIIACNRGPKKLPTHISLVHNYFRKMENIELEEKNINQFLKMSQQLRLFSAMESFVVALKEKESAVKDYHSYSPELFQSMINNFYEIFYAVFAPGSFSSSNMICMLIRSGLHGPWDIGDRVTDILSCPDFEKPLHLFLKRLILDMIYVQPKISQDAYFTLNLFAQILEKVSIRTLMKIADHLGINHKNMINNITDFYDILIKEMREKSGIYLCFQASDSALRDKLFQFIGPSSKSSSSTIENKSVTALSGLSKFASSSENQDSSSSDSGMHYFELEEDKTPKRTKPPKGGAK